jgi:murein DD-endopeptidase MepM/ murein hydrolase activator NlpD
MAASSLLLILLLALATPCEAALAGRPGHAGKQRRQDDLAELLRALTTPLDRLVRQLRLGWDLLVYRLKEDLAEGALAISGLRRGGDQMVLTVVPASNLSAVELPLSALLTADPVEGEFGSPFGVRRHPLLHRRRYHSGIDIAARPGTPVHAAGAGRVVQAGPAGAYGNLVIVDHGLGLESRYAHLMRVSVRVGQFVSAGAAIGAVGATGRATGPHLHFEVRHIGIALDPLLALARGDRSSLCPGGATGAPGPAAHQPLPPSFRPACSAALWDQPEHLTPEPW